MTSKRVSIIIPALNEEDGIGSCLASLARQADAANAFEVIVVDNGSTDRTREVARAFSSRLSITVLERPSVHVSALRNLGVDYAKGEVLAFLDADCLVPPEWVALATAGLEVQQIGALGAHFRLPADSGWVARSWYGTQESEKVGPLAWVPGCNTWVTRATFERVGRFDESIETNEDCEFCARVRGAGLKVMGDSRIAVIHLGAPATVSAFYRKISWHATDGLRVFLRDPFSLMNARPVVFGGYTLACLAGAAIGAGRAFWTGRFDLLALSVGALLGPSVLLSLRLSLKRRQWRSFVPLILLNLVYGLARGRSLLSARSWVRAPGRLSPAVAMHVFTLLCLMWTASSSFAATAITALWANDGEDKVTQDELRATRSRSVTNSVWDGTTISLFGGRNEVIAFNLILEAGSRAAGNVTVTFNRLTGPTGATLASQPVVGNGVFDWTQRPIELFYVRYLQIKGLSQVSYETYDERHVPERMRRPWSGNGAASGTWQSRPDHDAYYPDIAVPLELVPSFSIAAGRNQSIWVDVYVPKSTPPGVYQGQLSVKEAGTLVKSLPVELRVYDFTLPDTPSAKTMLVLSSDNINHRYLGNTYISPTSAAGAKGRLLRDRHFLLAHRHRISMIGDTPSDCAAPGDRPCVDWEPRLDGTLFTPANGYDGPGVNTGNNVYSIGTYGNWSWSTGNQAAMNQHSDAWVRWFEQQASNTEYFLYLIDESPNTAQIQTWAQWIVSNPGPGQRLKSMATIPLTSAAAQTPALDIPTTTLGVGIPSVWQSLADRYTNDPRKRFFMYNAHRPASGSMATEDDGVAPREIAWGQYKKKINRWFFWESTYYNNNQGGMGETNVFRTAQTFGTRSSVDAIVGEKGMSYSNGDGVLMYPGTDVLYPADSYGVDGPFASLRLKHWRRGIQDVEYLTMAAAVAPTVVQSLVNQLVPKALWEYGVDDPSDPTFVHTDVSWPRDPSVWENARLQLADILSGAGQGALVAPILNLPDALPVTASLSASYPPGYRISTYQWTLTLAKSVSNGFSAQGATPSGGTSYTLTTSNGSVPLAPLGLTLGYYRISVTVTDPLGHVSPPATGYVNLVSPDLSGMRVFPNPWRADRHSAVPVMFDHLTSDVTIALFTVSGHHVVTLRAAGGVATWDLTNASNDRVASGIYPYVVKAAGGPSSRGQVVIIR